MNVYFGVAGFPPNFKKNALGKKRDNIFEWLNILNLDWIELQNTYGVKMSDEQAFRYRCLSENFGIHISIHAPYFICFASKKNDVVERSKQRMLQCFELSKKIGAERIIFHPGYPSSKEKKDRTIGINNIIDALNELEPFRPANVFVYPETAGKKGQLGSVDEIIEICKAVKYARPCFDMAHIHGFGNGCLNDFSSIKTIFEKAALELGEKFTEHAHFHMYPVEYDINGEKKHKAFTDFCENEPDNLYHPTAENFIKALLASEVNATVICEARDTQDEGAQLMKKLYFRETTI